MAETARYDGLADWYERWARHTDTLYADTTDLLRRLAGDGPGRCLDLACGGGRMIPLLAGQGWSVVGCDVSADQLRVAERRVGDAVERLVRADAAALPFADREFDLVAATLAHTDVTEYAPVLREVARVLRTGGRFVHVGSHPCFCSPFAVRAAADRMVLHPGYWDTAWRTEAPAIGDGVRSRAGVRHVPLAELLNAVAGAGLRLTHAEEAHDRDFPLLLSLVAQKDAA
jgi:SAM-dependent methyltransferase